MKSMLRAVAIVAMVLLCAPAKAASCSNPDNLKDMKGEDGYVFVKIIRGVALDYVNQRLRHVSGLDGLWREAHPGGVEGFVFEHIAGFTYIITLDGAGCQVSMSYGPTQLIDPWLAAEPA